MQQPARADVPVVLTQTANLRKGLTYAEAFKELLGAKNKKAGKGQFWSWVEVCKDDDGRAVLGCLQCEGHMQPSNPSQSCSKHFTKTGVCNARSKHAAKVTAAAGLKRACDSFSQLSGSGPQRTECMLGQPR